MAIQIEKPEIKHKYISLFDTEAEFNAAYPSFEEVNWSDVAYPQERPDNYRVSRRLSNMYHKNTPPDYKFDDINDFVVEGDVTYYADGAYIGTFNEDDYINGNIRRTFFLEIVWGYSGWEWHDYERVIGTDPETEEPITETLTGGNLYKIKNIQTVPHIIDGQRLQHINDFLFSQYNVTKVEGFNTENLVAANRAFKRGTNDDTNYPKRYSSQILECHLVDAYDDNTLLDHYFGYGDTLDKLVEADMLFYNNKIYVGEGTDNTLPINIPNIKSVDKFYSYGVLTDNLKFKMESLEEFTDCFKFAILPRAIVNLNNIFIGSTLKKIRNFSGFLAESSITGYTESGSDKITTIQLDLTDSDVNSNEVIDLSHFAEWAGCQETGGSGGRYAIPNTILNIDLDFLNKVNLSEAFVCINGDKYSRPSYATFNYNGGFEKIRVNFNNKESYITSLKSAFANNTFIENLPVQQVPNNTCDDTYIYQGCVFNAPISYNFLNGSIVSPREQGYGQFNDCTINDNYAFSNIQGLDRVEFCGIKFGNNVAASDRAFPYVVQNQNDTTYRYFDMTNSKFVDTLPTQNIYIDSEKLRNSEDRYGIGTRNINPFARCSELTDLSNIHLYFSEINPDSNIQYSFDFSGCTNLTKTPYIHLNYYKTRFLYFGIDCHDLHSLTTVNFENLNFDSAAHEAQVINVNFNGCESLVYLKIATANANDKIFADIDLRGCYNLDIATLESTLYHLVPGSKLRCTRSVWEAMNTVDGVVDLINGPMVTYFTEHNLQYEYFD